MRILQAIQAAARFGRAVPIDAASPRTRRPDMRQEIHVPAHDKPELVDVQSGSK